MTLNVVSFIVLSWTVLFTWQEANASSNRVSIPWFAPMTESNCLSEMQMEQARITLSMANGGSTNETLYIYGVSSNCYHCLLLPLTNTALSKKNTSICVTLDTNYEYSIVISQASPFSGCNTKDDSTCAWQPSNTQRELTISYHFNEFSDYTISLSKSSSNGKWKYTINETKHGGNKYVPLYVIIGLILFVIICYNLYQAYLRKVAEKRYDEIYGAMSNMPPSILGDGSNNANVQSGKTRLVSLDAFRGMSLIIMIFVNYGGGGYYWLDHSTWNGLTVADLVFPWFIFIMGTAMAIVFPKQLAKLNRNPWDAMYQTTYDGTSISMQNVPNGASGTGAGRGLHIRMMTRSSRYSDSGSHSSNSMARRNKQHLQNQGHNHENVTNYSNNPRLNEAKVTRLTLMKRVIIRSIKLYLLGMLLNNGYDLEHWRIPGVLQYFAIAYLINAFILIFFEPKEDYIEIYCTPECRNLWMPEILLFWKQWIVALLILTINLLFVFLLRVDIYGDDCGTGYMGPGGIGDYGKHIECTGGAHRLIDFKVFGSKHIYTSPTVMEYYATGYYDPEGLLGSLTATFLCFLGMFLGRMLYVYLKDWQRIGKWWFYCIIFGLLAGILCGFSQNGGMIPLNKNMWSLSFILTQASTGMFVVSMFYLLIDVWRVWDGKPFHWLGQNSIIIYAGSEILQPYFPWSFQIGKETHYQLLISNCIGVACWIYIAYYLYKKKIFYNL